jgi:acetamidase/formamidase
MRVWKRIGLAQEGLLQKDAQYPSPFSMSPLLHQQKALFQTGLSSSSMFSVSFQVPVPSKVGNASLGEDLNKPMKDCYKKTRNFLMDSFGLEERETLALMSVGVDFGITEVVDGVWGELIHTALVAFSR